MHQYFTKKIIIRIIYNKPYLYHTKDLFKFNNILPFNDLVKYNTCEFMFKVYNNVHREIIIILVKNLLFIQFVT